MKVGKEANKDGGCGDVSTRRPRVDHLHMIVEQISRAIYYTYILR